MMIFTFGNKYKDLQKELEYLRNWKNVTETVEVAMKDHMARLEEEADQLFGFLHFLSENVTDYDGYVLRYMEEQENVKTKEG
jgi:hypothetical protein